MERLISMRYSNFYLPKPNKEINLPRLNRTTNLSMNTTSKPLLMKQTIVVTPTQVVLTTDDDKSITYTSSVGDTKHYTHDTLWPNRHPYVDWLYVAIVIDGVFKVARKSSSLTFYQWVMNKFLGFEFLSEFEVTSENYQSLKQCFQSIMDSYGSQVTGNIHYQPNVDVKMLGKICIIGGRIKSSTFKDFLELKDELNFQLQKAVIRSVEMSKSFSDGDVSIIFVLGGPGSGKGTVCEMLAQKFDDFCHLSSRDLLHSEQKSGIKEAKLDPSGMIEQIRQAMIRTGRKKFLIEGYPCTEKSRVAFNAALPVDSKMVLYLSCSHDVMLQRSLLSEQVGESDSTEIKR
ncbi:UMP-CMP kinase 2-like [Papaver somniferum]|uniref:UMP-CMP kinase 2-like n=1 Tax=Papaver somniferum TaxID=3469 RepID=UPI000E701D77|nr:UMP-CMP kinase 2-like [Papaver somniferum]XP_026413225.1 UMP-CMP kinase 2-like [Papaver somniferum]